MKERLKRWLLSFVGGNCLLLGKKFKKYEKKLIYWQIHYIHVGLSPNLKVCEYIKDAILHENIIGVVDTTNNTGLFKALKPIFSWFGKVGISSWKKNR